MFQSKIKVRVQAAIDARIKKAEEMHQQECDAIEAKAEQEKENHAIKMVDSIIGKI